MYTKKEYSVRDYVLYLFIDKTIEKLLTWPGGSKEEHVDLFKKIGVYKIKKKSIESKECSAGDIGVALWEFDKQRKKYLKKYVGDYGRDIVEGKADEEIKRWYIWKDWSEEFDFSDGVDSRDLNSERMSRSEVIFRARPGK